MPRRRPEFMKSPYFVDEPGNWHLTPDAPEYLQTEFESYMAELNEFYEPGTIFGNTIDYPFNK